MYLLAIGIILYLIIGFVIGSITFGWDMDLAESPSDLDDVNPRKHIGIGTFWLPLSIYFLWVVFYAIASYLIPQLRKS